MRQKEVIDQTNADKILIPLKEWYKQDRVPQLLLAAKVDQENNIETESDQSEVSIDNLKVLENIGLPLNVAKEQFGCLLDALEMAPPPHGGIAFG